MSISPVLSREIAHSVSLEVRELFLDRVSLEIKQGNLEEALEDLFLLLRDSHNKPSDNLKATYSLIQEIIPQLELKQVEELEQQLERFLFQTSKMAMEQRNLALSLADFYSKKENQYVCAMHLFAKAILITEEHNLPGLEQVYLGGSRLFIQIVDFYLIKSGRFLSKANRAIGNVSPEEFYLLFQQIYQLKSFCYVPEDREIIQELFKQLRSVFISKINKKNIEQFSQFSPLIQQGLVEEFALSENFILKRYRRNLFLFRDAFERKYESCVADDPDAVSALQKEVAKSFQALIIDPLLKDIFTILGEPPCRYDIRAMGSVGGEEMCPRSDLEWMVLIESDLCSEEFKIIAHLLKIQCIAFGETSNHFSIYFSSSKTKSGLYIDMSPVNVVEFVGSPETLANQQISINKDRAYLPNGFANTMRTSTSLSCTGQELFTEYQAKMQAILSQPIEEKTGLIKDNRERKAIELLKVHLADYRKLWNIPPERQHIINLKTQYVELLNHLLNTLCLYFNVLETNTLDCIDALAKKGIFIRESQKLLKRMVAGIYMIRVQLHLKYKEQKETALMGTPSLETLSEYALTIKEKDLLRCAYWLVLKPLYSLIEGWIGEKNGFQNIDLLRTALLKETITASENFKAQRD